MPQSALRPDIVLEICKSLVPNAEELARFDPPINPTLGLGLKTACFCSWWPSAYRSVRLDPGDVDSLRLLAGQDAPAADHALDYYQVAESRKRLAEERVYLNEEIRSGLNLEEIVGSSAALKNVLKPVAIVAPTDSTLLVLGETGPARN